MWGTNRRRKISRAVAALGVALALPVGRAQSAQQTAPQAETGTPAPAASVEPASGHGKVLFSREADTSLNPDAEQQAPATQTQAAPVQTPAPVSSASVTPAKGDSLGVTDAERDALTFTDYDLDVHLTPASAGISVRAGITVRNDGAAALTRLTLQISSSMHWDAISIRTASGGSSTPLVFTSHLVNTDADHTGKMSEAVVTLAQPLAPGASLVLTTVYSGAIAPSAERLERIGAPDDQAVLADWDAIAPELTALRGFGNVLWVPVSTAPAFLGDEAKLFQLVGRAKLRQAGATVRLRLAVEYVGDPPDTVFFCGQRQKLKAISDNADLPAAESPGVATAVFETQSLGFRAADLFITDRPASETGTNANPTLIDAVTSHYDALPVYAAAAGLVEPLLTDWFGAGPLTALSLIDSNGQPFEDDELVVRPIRGESSTTLAASLAHSLTHVWVHSNQAWINEGLAQFMGLLWIERSVGREAALNELQSAARPLALIEPETPASVTNNEPGLGVGSTSTQTSSSSSSSSSQDEPESANSGIGPAGASLIAATGDVFYRTKAAAVWWMLRGIVGDDALKQALQTYRLDAKLDRDPAGFERALEKTSHKDLRWFFNDWVYRDRGLPDLSIASVTPSQLTARNGLPSGWLVAIEVRNDGYAAAEVPVTVRSATASETQRLRIAGRTSISTRMVFAGKPQEVQVNDGGVPETQTSIHTRQLILPGR